MKYSIVLTFLVLPSSKLSALVFFFTKVKSISEIAESGSSERGDTETKSY